MPTGFLRSRGSSASRPPETIRLANDPPAALCSRRHARRRAEKETAMADTAPRSYIYVGSAHWGSEPSDRNPGGLFRRAVGDDHWEPLGSGLPQRAQIRAISVHPAHSQGVYVCTQDWPYRYTHPGNDSERLPFPDFRLAVL